MKTTADCKKFLVDFFKDTPNLIIEIYGRGEDEGGKEAFNFSQDVKNWKRDIKCKPGSENSYIHGDTTEVWEKGKSYPRGPSYHAGVGIAVSRIAVERHFTLKEDVLDSGVRFMVLETQEGELLLGEYIGD
jgi:hypothetical protein